MKIACIVGTRPEIIKCAPVIRAIEQTEDMELLLIHSGQHYSEEMDTQIVNDLKLDQPHYNLHVGSGTHASQTGKIMISIEDIFMKEKPDYVLVQGDTNTVLAASLAAKKLHIRVGHIEAGLRSYDDKMPEETNRIVTDHIADALFAPTQESAEILLHEGINADKILVTGNTIVDSVYQNLELAQHQNKSMQESSGADGNLVYLTAHRAENVDDKKRLKHILESISAISRKHKLSIVWPMHPRTRQKIELFRFDKMLPSIRGLKITKPVGFLESLNLIEKSRFIMTDSGGLQEEACILGTPCITLRENTERPETIEVGANILVGTSQEKITSAVDHILLEREKNWTNPFGDGTSGKQIVTHLRNQILSSRRRITRKTHTVS
jgi:UDP-N-acetylglucosamine 2-epimerase (non-hydrolysing)